MVTKYECPECREQFTLVSHEWGDPDECTECGYYACGDDRCPDYFGPFTVIDTEAPKLPSKPSYNPVVPSGT